MNVISLQKDKPDHDVLQELASYYDLPVDSLLKNLLEVHLQVNCLLMHTYAC